MFASGKSCLHPLFTTWRESRSRGKKRFMFHFSASTLCIIALCDNPCDFMTKLVLLHEFSEISEAI